MCPTMSLGKRGRGRMLLVICRHTTTGGCVRVPGNTPPGLSDARCRLHDLRRTFRGHGSADMSMKRSKKRATVETPPDLDNLINSLDVKFVGLAECLVSSGYTLEMPSLPALGIHYNMIGSGQMSVSGGTSIELTPHTLI